MMAQTSGGNMLLIRQLIHGAAVAFMTLACVTSAAYAQQADGGPGCTALPNHGTLKAALEKATAEEKSGLNNHMWATIVDRDGVVCAVAFSGSERSAQWPGSRVISAQKASTANAFGLDVVSASRGSGQTAGLALSTANLYSAVQPGGSLFGLQFSNPVDTAVAYRGPYAAYGTPKDPMVGSRVGGVNVFGGGLALFPTTKRMIGGVGVSGDTSCADHNIAWRLRNFLGLDHLAGVGGVSGDQARPDNIVFDIAGGSSKGGFGHPECPNTGDATMLPPVRP
jgi:uncharacterized protein GlcG (DUF336 family)